MSHRRSQFQRLTGGVDAVLAWLAAAGGVAFAILAIAVALHPDPFFFDRPIAIAVQSINWGPFSPFNDLVSALGGLTGVVVGALVIVAAVVLKRSIAPFVAFSAIYSGIYNGVNVLIQRPRPTGLPHSTHHLVGFSFPSGHVAFLVWLGALAILLLGPKLPKRLFSPSVAIVGLLVLLGSLSRIYVGAHWPSDVLGGLLVGLGWMALTLSIGRLAKPLSNDAAKGG
jgi:membrane-associated phospholipid phosphatase